VYQDILDPTVEEQQAQIPETRPGP